MSRWMLQRGRMFSREATRTTRRGLPRFPCLSAAWLRAVSSDAPPQVVRDNSCRNLPTLRVACLHVACCMLPQPAHVACCMLQHRIVRRPRPALGRVPVRRAAPRAAARRRAQQVLALRDRAVRRRPMPRAARRRRRPAPSARRGSIRSCAAPIYRYLFVLFNDALVYAKKPLGSSLYKLHKR
jgi:hypothetical protein